jgi:hypothetical protein
MNRRPETGDCSAYFERYVRLVPEGDIEEILERQLADVTGLLGGITEQQADFRYAENKWTLKEVVGHISDTERILAGRLVRIARGDRTPLPGFDSVVIAQGAPFDAWSFSHVMEDYQAVRRATFTLVKGLTEEAWKGQGTASGIEITAAALAYIIAGHELHHLNVIKDKYLR